MKTRVRGASRGSGQAVEGLGSEEYSTQEVGGRLGS